VKREVSGDGEERELTIEFKGKHSEYFPLWITNLCLSLLSFGVYSAWAKVRKKRYLYSHTILDGTPFEYRGRPLPIFKGRLVATSLLGLWFLLGHYFGSLNSVVFAVALAILPWMMVRTLSFNARCSAYRNMTFDFHAGYADALKVLVGSLLIVAMSCGLGAGAAQHRMSRFLVQNLGFGGQRGKLYATSRPYVLAYLKSLVVLVLSAFLLALVLFPFIGDEATGALLGTGIGYVGYFCAYAYMRSVVLNTTWGESELGPVVFESSLRPRKFVWLYFTNAVAIVASLGLLIPWATLRTARYRTERLRLFVHGELREFVAEPRPAPSASGAELADFMELDVSL
jgi:uncharacterized membrane protein YjgN (DUF898 family)